jgi:hypothetical protein
VRQYRIEFTCDLCGVGVEAIETVALVAGGDTIEVDLCDAHASAYWTSVAPFVAAAARRTGLAACGRRRRRCHKSH